MFLNFKFRNKKNGWQYYLPWFQTAYYGGRKMKGVLQIAVLLIIWNNGDVAMPSAGLAYGWILQMRWITKWGSVTNVATLFTFIILTWNMSSIGFPQSSDTFGINFIDRKVPKPDTDQKFSGWGSSCTVDKSLQVQPGRDSGQQMWSQPLIFATVDCVYHGQRGWSSFT